jgi:hypothetical protein
MIETFLAAPVASIIFVLPGITSLMAFSNENMYGNFILNPYVFARAKGLYRYYQRLDP